MKKTVLLNQVAVGEYESTGDLEKDAEIVRQLLKDKGLHKETSLFQAIFNQAVSFANTSAYLYENDLKKSPAKGESAAPFVVNAAFSIELYIKALAQKHGKRLHGHKLVELHNELPKDAILEIESVIPQCAVNRGVGNTFNFTEYLQDLNKSFVEWRYSYELYKTGVVNIQQTIFVMEVLHEACRKKPAA